MNIPLLNDLIISKFNQKLLECSDTIEKEDFQHSV